jgi:purine nucleoside phosphorylase
MPKELGLVKTAIVLGSGLTDFVNILENQTALSYDKIEGWYIPKKKIKGH